MPSLTIAVLRLSMAAAILTPYVLGNHRGELRRLQRRDLLYATLAGLMFGASLFALFLAIEHTTVLIAISLSNMHPLLVALFEIFLLKTLLNWRIWIGLALALGGTLVYMLAGISGMSGLGPQPVLGAAVAFISALTSAFYFILGRSVRKRVSVLVFMWLVLLSGAALGLIVSLLTGTPLLGFSLQNYVFILLLTLAGQVIGQSLLAYCLAYLPATFVSVSMQGIAVVSAVWALLIFAERPGPLQILASGIIIAGVIMVIASRARARVQEPHHA